MLAAFAVSILVKINSQNQQAFQSIYAICLYMNPLLCNDISKQLLFSFILNEATKSVAIGGYPSHSQETKLKLNFNHVERCVVCRVTTKPFHAKLSGYYMMKHVMESGDIRTEEQHILYYTSIYSQIKGLGICSLQ